MWDDQKIEMLRDLAAQRLSAEKIGVALGKTRNAIIGKCARHKIVLQGGAQRLKRQASPRAMGGAPKRSCVVPPPKPRARPFAEMLASIADRHEPTQSDDPVAPFGNGKALIDLERDDCRWPIGDPQNSDFRFCAHRKFGGLPYCEHHAKRAYGAPEAQERAVRRHSAILGACVPAGPALPATAQPRETEGVQG